MIDTLLIANRGEIACRVIRTARAMGMTTVAVFSDADAQALHVQMADRAIHIGASAPRESYLNIDRIVQACRESGAQAVHPGYGFLSENAEFARALRTADLIFVGPPPEAIDALGNKAAAKLLAQRIGVPCLPGYSGKDQSTDVLLREATRIGAPLMIKATAGGGGRGMRRCDDVSDPAAVAALLDSARAEALASFGNGDLLLERLVVSARHVEVQVFGDQHGGYVHLGERDCSTQRRNQKILEEAPAPGVSPQLREAMGEAAIALARSVGYVGAGTIEFLLAPDGQFSFLEMNTRLQVEHPVTEAVTGLDLVEWQLRVARGETLPLQQAQIRIEGHAVEARVCAEDAYGGFVPQSGTIAGWDIALGTGVRLDHGLTRQPTIPPNYDSMIAKVIAHGASRDQAIARLTHTLAQTTLFGIVTNRDFLLQCLRAPAFMNAELSTAWLTQAMQGWAATPISTRWAALAAAAHVHRLGSRHGALANWTASGPRVTPVRLTIAGAEVMCRLTASGNGHYRVNVEGDHHDIELDSVPGPKLDRLVPRIDGQRQHVAMLLDELGGFMDGAGAIGRFEDLDRTPPVRADAAAGGTITSHMHGLVTRTLATVGQQVGKGDLLLAIEAMKMEHRIEAPVTGTILELGVDAGQQVVPGALLIRIEPASPPSA